MAGEVDPFEAAFASLVKDQKEGDTVAPNLKLEDQSQDPPAAVTQDPPAQVQTAQDPPAAEGDDPAPETELAGLDKDGQPIEQTQQGDRTTDADAINRLAELMAAREQQDVQRNAQEAAQRDAQARARNVQQQVQGIYTPDDETFLRQYHTDFGDVARGEALVRRAEYSALVGHIFKQINDALAPRLALLEQLADAQAYGALAQQVPNYDTMRDQVVDWVKTQPTYLQPAYNHVIQNGTVAEISDLFNRYSAATGAQAASHSGGGEGDRTTQASAQQGGRAAPVAPSQSTELSPAAKNAAARLAPVSGKRSAPTQGAPQTFDAAFDLFAKELAKAG